MKLSYEGDAKKAASFTGKVQQELDRLQARLSSIGLDRGSFQHVLDDNSYAYGYILPGGLRVAHIVTSEGVSETLPLYDAVETKTPDFLSGYVGNGLVQAATPATDDAAAEPAMLRNYTPSQETARIHAAELTRLPKVVRLAVYPWSAFDTLGLGTEAFAQTQTIYPTQYSGRMRKVVQALFGFGKQPDGEDDISIFDAVDPDFDVVDGDTEEPQQSQYELEVEASGRQVRYDYRFMRTHGITIAADGEVWLVEIGMNRGILAMLLPLHEHTRTAEFRDLVYEADRQEAILMLDEFGGFPTGEAFPNTPDSLEANIRAGRVLRLKTAAELSEFYSHTGYSSVMGWAFNDSGSEAHNTGWRYGDDGVQRGVHYAVALNIGSYVPFTAVETAYTVLELILDLKAQRPEQYDAVVYKLGRMTEEQFDAVLDPGMTALQTFDAIDALVLSPIAAATAGISKCSEGKIYWPTANGQPQIKFPEPLLGGLLSHDMQPATFVDSGSQLCDTLMHVFFSGDDLKWVKYYNNASQWRAGWTWEGADQWDVDYTPVGDFYQAYVLGPVDVPPMFYSNDIDNREEMEESKLEWFHHRTVVGYVGPWSFNLTGGDSPQASVASPPPDEYSKVLYRSKRFLYAYEFHYSTSRTLSAAVAVPFYDREAYYLATLRKKTGGDVQNGTDYHDIGDPHISWTPAFSDIITTESYYPDGAIPQSEVWDYQKGFADSGEWGPIGDNINGYPNGKAQAVPDSPSSSVVTHVDATGSLVTKLVTSSIYDIVEMENEARVGDEEVGLWEPLWFLKSPDDYGDYQFIAETNNVLGDVQCMVFGTHLLDGSRDVIGAPTAAKDSTYYPCFIGPYNG